MEYYKNLNITLSNSLLKKIENSKAGEALLTLLTDLDQKAIGCHKNNNMRITMIQSSLQKGEENIREKEKTTEREIENIVNSITVAMLATIGDGGGIYASKGFKYVNENNSSVKNTLIEYQPITIDEKFGTLTRQAMYFIDQPGFQERTFYPQPFIERSDEKGSIEFVEEYYKYCCNPTEYTGSNVKQENMGSQEWFPITPDILKHMEAEVGVSFSELKIYNFFSTEYKNKIMPTHGLLCHMFLINNMATIPGWISGGHLGDLEKHNSQFEYYAQFLIDNDEHVIPNRQGFIKLLKILITILKNKKEYGGRLLQQEISIEELFPLMQAKNIGPFELYENLIREQFRLVDNITEGDTIGFKLTATGAMFLYMCCPNIY